MALDAYTAGSILSGQTPVYQSDSGYHYSSGDTGGNFTLADLTLPEGAKFGYAPTGDSVGAQVGTPEQLMSAWGAQYSPQTYYNYNPSSQRFTSTTQSAEEQRQAAIGALGYKQYDPAMASRDQRVSNPSGYGLNTPAGQFWASAQPGQVAQWGDLGRGGSSGLSKFIGQAIVGATLAGFGGGMMDFGFGGGALPDIAEESLLPQSYFDAGGGFVDPATTSGVMSEYAGPDMSFLDADPGGFVNPATGQPGPGLPGGVDYGPVSVMSNYGSDASYGMDSNFGFDVGANLMNNPSVFGSVASRASPSFSSSVGQFLENKFSGPQGIGNALSLGSGVYGLYQQAQMRKKAEEAQRQAQLAQQQAQAQGQATAQQAQKLADPWGASGGRAAADAQLQAFMKDPMAAAASDPSYALRIQAAQRQAAPYGQGSGKMAIDAANASTDWYNQRLAQLGGMAGTNVNPGTGAGFLMQGQQLGLEGAGIGLRGAQIGLEGQAGANDLASKALASIGYGFGRDNIPPAMQQQLMIRMMQQMGQGA